MSRVSTWPFPAGPAHREAAPDPLDDARESLLDEMADEQESDSPYCECDNELMLSELDSGKCITCGRALIS